MMRPHFFEIFSQDYYIIKVSPIQSNYDRERKEETGNVRTAIC